METSGGKVDSKGMAIIYVPFKPIQDILILRTQLLESPSRAPILVSMQVMNQLRIELRNVSSEVVQVDSGRSVAVKFVHQLPVYNWSPCRNIQIHRFLWATGSSSCLYTEEQLRNIHKRLGHPSSKRIMSLLQRSSRYEHIDPTIRAKLEEIEKNCNACQMFAGPPQRFRFRITDDDGRFNHELVVDIMHVDGLPVLHVIDADTRFQAAQFLKDQKSQTIWDALRRCWIDVFCGPPDVVKVDSGSNFTSTEFAQTCAAYGILLRVVPVEAHHLIGVIERHHAILRKVYSKLKSDMPNLSRESLLSMSVRAANDSTGPNGIVPTVRVFGIYPKLGLPNELPAPKMLERVKCVAQATRMASEEYARRIVHDASKKGPLPNFENIQAVRSMKDGDRIYVHRETRGWTGPHTILSKDDERVTVESKTGSSTFPISACKPAQETLYSKGLPIFENSRKVELEKLISIGTFEIVPRSNAEGSRVFHGTFVDVLKSSGIPKSRLVACATYDNVQYLTASPTVQRCTTRSIYAIAACRRDFCVKFRDVTMAFLQSETLLERKVFMEPPPELNLPSSSILLIKKPLYGLPESPMHWYSTFSKYHKDDQGLGMTMEPHDPCLFTAYDKDRNCIGIITLQVDDSTIIGTKEFQEFEEQKSSRFPNKGGVYVDSVPREQNGAMVKRTTVDGEELYCLSQEKYLKNLREIESSCPEREYRELRSLNATAAFVAHGSRPDILIHVALFSQITARNYTNADRIRFNKFARDCRESEARTLTFVGLDLSSMHLAVFVDASFASNYDGSSQLGVLVCLRDSTGRCNVIHATCVKSRRIARSSLAAEIFAILEGFDVGYIMKVWLSKVFKRNLDLHILTDSRTGFHTVTTLVTTKEKRLTLDLYLLREAYERKELTKISWITGESNPADGLTKIKHNGVLGALLAKTHVDLHAAGWVDRLNHDLQHSEVRLKPEREKHDTRQKESAAGVEASSGGAVSA